MSSTSLRTVAATIAAVIALLTAIATGLLSTSQTCTRTVVSAPGVPTAAPTVTVTVTDAAGGVGAAANGDLGGTASGQGQKQAPAPKTTTPAAPTYAAGKTCTSDSSFAVVPALIAFLGTVFLGAVLMLLLLMASRRPGATPAVAPVSPGPAPAAGAGGGARAETERKSLIQAVIYVRDRVTSKALADRLGTALHDVGVEIIDPVGARFDPAHHEAGGSQPSDDPARVGSIAAVEVPGYADRGRLLRAPVVTVYQAGRPSGRGTDRSRGDHR
jgi:hypothetical protein